jgi:hypothetical protein
MDDDGESYKQEKDGDPLPNAGDVLQPFWVQRDIQGSDGYHRFLLDYCTRFLPLCGSIFWIIYLLS